MEHEKKIWIDKVLNSTKNLKRVKPSADLFDRIDQGLGESHIGTISLYNVRLIAAASVLLLTLNLIGIKTYLNSNQQPETISYEEIYTEDFFFTNYISSY